MGSGGQTLLAVLFARLSVERSCLYPFGPLSPGPGQPLTTEAPWADGGCTRSQCLQGVSAGMGWGTPACPPPASRLGRPSPAPVRISLLNLRPTIVWWDTRLIQVLLPHLGTQ